MNKIIKIFSLIFLLNLTNNVEPSSNLSNNVIRKLKDPKKITNCKAELDDGTIIDLSSLDNVNSPKTASTSEYNYLFNPCTPINCVSPQAVCQQSLDGKTKYDLGDQDSSQFSSDDSGSVYIKFNTLERKTNLKCACGSGDTLSFVNEKPSNNYNLIFTSKCCCPDGCKGGKKGGLSLGSILLIIFFSIIGVYFIGGVLIMKFVKKSNGVEVIPNSSFWISTPGLDGFSFIISRFRSKGYSSI